MRNFSFILVFLSFLLFACPDTYASLFAPSCICKIQARVLSVKEEAVPKTQFQPNDLVAVNMEIEILKVIETVQPGITEEAKCEELYKGGRTLKVQVIKEIDFEGKGQQVKAESVIQGNIEASGDEHGTWFNFDKIQSVEADKQGGK